MDEDTLNETFEELNLGERTQEATGNDPESPVPEQTMSMPFVYGSIAQAYDIPLANGHTHQWTIYLRPIGGQDISRFISKVDFKLHEDFEMPIRICTQPPYEVTETGWGEFQVPIRIHFRDRVYCQRPLVVMHFLKLYETSGLPIDPDNPIPRILTSSPNPIISESYDEFVFSNPPFEVQLQVDAAAEHQREDLKGPNVDWNHQKEEQLRTIMAGEDVIKEQIALVNERIALLKKEFDALCKVKRDAF